MVNKSIDVFIASLKKMINHCQDIQTLLQGDKDHFVKNDLSSLNESNLKKSALLDNLNLLVKELSADNYPEGLLKTIRQENQNLDQASQRELENNMTELKSEITKCYKYITLNSSVISANMQQLKELWEKLLSLHAEKNCLYDHTGNTVK